MEYFLSLPRPRGRPGIFFTLSLSIAAPYITWILRPLNTQLRYFVDLNHNICSPLGQEPNSGPQSPPVSVLPLRHLLSLKDNLSGYFYGRLI